MTRPQKSSTPYEPSRATVSEIDAAIWDERGKVVLVDFWATWCRPCVASFPDLVNHHKKHAAEGLIVFAVSMDEADDLDKVRGFLKARDASFECFVLKSGDRDDGKMMTDRFKYPGTIPHAVLFNKSGERVWAGNPGSGNLEKRIEAELAR